MYLQTLINFSSDCALLNNGNGFKITNTITPHNIMLNKHLNKRAVLPSLNIPNKTKNVSPAVQLRIYNGEVPTRTSAGTLSILRRVVVCLSPQSNARAVPVMRPQSLSFAPFPIHYSLIILRSDTMQSELPGASLNKPSINTFDTRLARLLVSIFTRMSNYNGGNDFVKVNCNPPPHTTSQTNKINCRLIS